MEKGPPKNAVTPLAVNYFLVGELRGWIAALEGTPEQSSAARLRHWLISYAGSCGACWEAAADGVGVPGAVNKPRHFGEMYKYLTNTVCVHWSVAI